MTISVVIPTLNEEKIIEKTLKQIRENLTAFDHEIIVTDSQSSDKTVLIAKKYAKVIIHERAKGRTIAWNKNQGAAAATGDYLVFLDADVFVPDPNAFFKIALGDFAAKPKLVALTGNLRVFPEEETLGDKIIFRGYVNNINWLTDNVFHGGAACGEFQMIKRETFQKLGGYREHLAVAEDHDMFIRLRKVGDVFFDRRLTVFHTGRRGHELGWPRLFWSWVLNYFSVRFLDRSHDKEWKPIR